jgi:hypothetical protein
LILLAGLSYRPIRAANKSCEWPMTNSESEKKELFEIETRIEL